MQRVKKEEEILRLNGLAATASLHAEVRAARLTVVVNNEGGQWQTIPKSSLREGETSKRRC